MSLKTYADICLERASMATEGPWKFGTEGNDEKGCHFVQSEFGLNLLTYNWDTNEYKFETADGIECEPDDLRFISHARTDVPELARRLKKAIAMLRTWSPDNGLYKLSDLADELESPLLEAK